MKLEIELKRVRHVEAWAAIETQFERFCTQDALALGYGIYGVVLVWRRIGGSNAAALRIEIEHGDWKCDPI